MFYKFFKPFIFQLDAETAHDLTLKTLAKMPLLMPPAHCHQPLQLMGINFPNRLGLAAGLDKNGIAIPAFDRSGLGFIEVGTVTPKAQTGNPKPRLFRLPEHQAIINRMGFNNRGIDALITQVSRVRNTTRALIGINLGKNKDTPNDQAHQDYTLGMERAYPHADYLTINVSSPNTEGLRDLQHGDSLRQLLETIKDKQQQLQQSHQRHVPVVVKIAPDNDDTALSQMLDSIAQAQIDGIIATNTTLDKSVVSGHRHANEQGGLSGQPLTTPSTAIIQRIRQQLPDIPLIASGGVMSAEDMRAKLDAGADLVQIYSGLIYQGPCLIKQCLNALERQV